MNIAQASIQGDRAVIEGPHAERTGERIDRRKPLVDWRKARAQDHPLGVLSDQVGGDRRKFPGKSGKQACLARKWPLP